MAHGVQIFVDFSDCKMARPTWNPSPLQKKRTLVESSFKRNKTPLLNEGSFDGKVGGVFLFFPKNPDPSRIE